MSALQVLIADDEEIARKRLSRLLVAIPEVEIVGECSTGDAVLHAVAHRVVDVILLDIRMPGLSGLDATALLPSPAPYIIFCTAHAEHAVEAFDVGAVDYLLKPIDAARLKKAIERARTHALDRHSAARRTEKAATELHRLAIPTRTGIVLMNPHEVSHAVLEGELVSIVATGSTHLTHFSLQELLERLAEGTFARVHRRAIVNLERVSRLEPNEVGGFTARMLGGHSIEVSRAAARELKKRLGLC